MGDGAYKECRVRTTSHLPCWRHECYLEMGEISVSRLEQLAYHRSQPIDCQQKETSHLALPLLISTASQL